MLMFYLERESGNEMTEEPSVCRTKFFLTHENADASADLAEYDGREDSQPTTSTCGSVDNCSDESVASNGSAATVTFSRIGGEGMAAVNITWHYRFHLGRVSASISGRKPQRRN